MKLKTIAFAATLAFMGGLLAACGGDDESNPNPPPPPPPPPPSAVSFTDFVHMVLKKPANSTPVTVNGVDFKFPDLNNPDAYDDVLPPPTDDGG